MAIRTLLSVVVLLTLTFQAVKAQTAPATSDSLTTLTGKWVGTFDGPTTGKLELVLSQDSNRKITGKITAINNSGDQYTAELKTVVWQNGKLTITYAYPEGGDINLSGNYAKSVLKGTWELDGGQATGTWQASR
ncbi:hypothetical protein [Spirosoma fluviale]|uniref:Uncharacterized protein n=1 Tax=Spirosoma fluviale TaxID=1597977 RepID=A0A286G430_9BACT|nr:hypothetical protein [Spirosoma fluviale]SOD90291.1 hypothetical protein SAMN06269250_3365 [Spirosoma fluviale]